MKKPMNPFEVWDVVKVPFPYTNRPIQKHRPALVIVRTRSRELPELLWVLMITSRENRGWPGDLEIHDLQATGLPHPSVIRSAKIATIDADSAERIGRIPEKEREPVRRVIRERLLGLEI